MLLFLSVHCLPYFDVAPLLAGEFMIEIVTIGIVTIEMVTIEIGGWQRRVMSLAGHIEERR